MLSTEKGFLGKRRTFKVVSATTFPAAQSKLKPRKPATKTFCRDTAELVIVLGIIAA